MEEEKGHGFRWDGNERKSKRMRDTLFLWLYGSALCLKKISKGNK